MATLAETNNPYKDAVNELIAEIKDDDPDLHAKMAVREEYDEEIMGFYDSWIQWVEDVDSHLPPRYITLKCYHNTHEITVTYRYVYLKPTDKLEDASFHGMVVWAWDMRGKELTDRIEKIIKHTDTAKDKYGRKWMILSDGRTICNEPHASTIAANIGYL